MLFGSRSSRSTVHTAPRGWIPANVIARLSLLHRDFEWCFINSLERNAATQWVAVVVEHHRGVNHQVQRERGGNSSTTPRVIRTWRCYIHTQCMVKHIGPIRMHNLQRPRGIIYYHRAVYCGVPKVLYIYTCVMQSEESTSQPLPSVATKTMRVALCYYTVILLYYLRLKTFQYTRLWHICAAAALFAFNH